MSKLLDERIMKKIEELKAEAEVESLEKIIYNHGRGVCVMRKVNELKVELSQFRQAVGLATTVVPSMQMDAEDPIGMMHKVVNEVERLKLIEVCWSDFKTMCEEFGFRGTYKGGIIRWAQDRIDRRAE